MQQKERYIIYVRKSTDVEDKQILSVEAQIVELKKYAQDNGLFIVDTVVEKQSAKKPGRKKFNAMMSPSPYNQQLVYSRIGIIY